MVPDKIDYPFLLQLAMRDIVCRVLTQVAEHGLPGEHHFYIGFRTDFPGVEIPRFLRDQYPQEMTIILQKQFWELEVDADGFSVLLSFGGSRQRLIVPFRALTAFADPSTGFALRLEALLPGEPSTEEESAAGAQPAGEADGDEESSRSAEVLRFDPSRKR